MKRYLKLNYKHKLGTRVQVHVWVRVLAKGAQIFPSSLDSQICGLFGVGFAHRDLAGSTRHPTQVRH